MRHIHRTEHQQQHNTPTNKETTNEQHSTSLYIYNYTTTLNAYKTSNTRATQHRHTKKLHQQTRTQIMRHQTIYIYKNTKHETHTKNRTSATHATHRQSTKSKGTAFNISVYI